MNKELKLNTGAMMPTVGLGTWEMDPKGAAEAVRYAIVEAGYRHIDCASVYGNEKEVGKGIALAISEGVKREELFITSKLWNTDHDPERVEAVCQKTLSDLGLEYLDLYLVHWALPFANLPDSQRLDEQGRIKLEPIPMQDTWKAMELLVESGKTRAIGVANFNGPLLVDLDTYATIKPAVNQIELHPHLSQQALVDFCTFKDIVVTAYSPLARVDQDIMQNEQLAAIAKTHGKSIPQVLLNWSVARGTIAIPKSSKPERLVENIDIFDFELSDDEVAQINSLNKNHRYVDPSEWWGIPYFS